MHKIPLNCTVAKPLNIPTIPFKTRKIWQNRARKWKKNKKIILRKFTKSAIIGVEMHKIHLTLNCTVAKPLKLPTIPFKTRNICQFRSFKCKKNGKIFLGTFSKYLLKIGDYRRCMHKIPLTNLGPKNGKNIFGDIFKIFFENWRLSVLRCKNTSDS